MMIDVDNGHGWKIVWLDRSDTERDKFNPQWMEEHKDLTKVLETYGERVSNYLSEINKGIWP